MADAKSPLNIAQSEKEWNDILEKWWSDACKAEREALFGRLMYDESIDSMNVFRKMGLMGFLTSCSQEGFEESYVEGMTFAASADLMMQAIKITYSSIDYGTDKHIAQVKGDSELIDENYLKLGGRFCKPKPFPKTYRERSFVSGVMHRDLARLFIPIFNHSDLIAFCDSSCIPVTAAHSNTTGPTLPEWIPMCTHLPLCMGGGDSRGSQKSGAKYELANAIESPSLQGRIEKIIDDLVVVHCIDPVWSRSAQQKLYPAVLAAISIVRRARKDQPTLTKSNTSVSELIDIAVLTLENPPRTSVASGVWPATAASKLPEAAASQSTAAAASKLPETSTSKTPEGATSKMPEAAAQSTTASNASGAGVLQSAAISGPSKMVSEPTSG